ncbi:MAG TPA: bacillithiol biosynthesis cysteine-adding enzyme BshC [Aquaticitalea sp.]|nr:bacillithiol biosynthesis cysteine-adding enzyme BshC [Aquaticitalea sp.]
MQANYIPYSETRYFSSLICDYLVQKEHLKPYYNRFSSIENFKGQIKEKQKSYDHTYRDVLTNALMVQYEGFDVSPHTLANIKLLNDRTTYTVTTGHQLNLFTGPLYFFYKIISAINLCKALKTSYPDYDFVPIYWMASEDHDFEEINFFNFKGKKVQWNREASGAVGGLDLDGLDLVYDVYASQLDKSKNAETLKDLFKSAYLEHADLASATRFLVNALFKDHGLVIVDGNDLCLKRLFVPYIQNELVDQLSFDKVTETNEKLSKLEKGYKIQVHPREINLFYIKGNLRERIVEKNGLYEVLHTGLRWDKDELLQEVAQHPDRFSPNVILRPLYQEVILPNLCYIGGGGELAYWLQLKSNFEAQNVVFPILLLRNSVLVVSQKQKVKLEKLGLSVADLFLSQNDLMDKITKALSDINIDFSSQKAQLKKQFQDLHQLAEQTDKSFKGAVAAQETKQIKGLEHLEQRLLKAQKRKLSDILERAKALQDELFPRQGLQERNVNFSEFYLEYGKAFISKLTDNLQPLKEEFLVLGFNELEDSIDPVASSGK